MKHVYVIDSITPHPLLGATEATPEALAQMKERSKEWPNVRWAAAQCVDMGSRAIGELKFFAIGPENTIHTITAPTLGHWSYYWVGWVDLESGKIVSEVPQ